MTLTTATPGPQGCISPDEMWVEPKFLEPLLPFSDGIAAGLPLSDSPQPAEPTEEGAPPAGEAAEAEIDLLIDSAADLTDLAASFDWGNTEEQQNGKFLVGFCGMDAAPETLADERIFDAPSTTTDAGKTDLGPMRDLVQ